MTIDVGEDSRLYGMGLGQMGVQRESCSAAAKPPCLLFPR